MEICRPPEPENDKECQQRRAEILASCDDAEASLRRGEGIDITPETMRTLAEDIGARGRERLIREGRA